MRSLTYRITNEPSEFHRYFMAFWASTCCRSSVKGEKTILRRSILSSNIYVYGCIFFLSETFSVMPTRIRILLEKQSRYLRTALSCLSKTEDNNLKCILYSVFFSVVGLFCVCNVNIVKGIQAKRLQQTENRLCRR